MKLRKLLLSLALCAMCVGQASALEFTYDAPEDYLFGRPTSQDTPYTQEDPNVDRSKNAALIPPSFGSPSANTLNTGTPLTPNLAPGYQPSGGAVAGGSPVTIQPPNAVPDTSTTLSPAISIQYTAVTGDLTYSGGYLGTLKIPSIGVNVKIYEGTGSKALAKGAGHFEETSIWAGNVGLAGHNRGVTNHFGKIHTLNVGDPLTLTTKLGTRTYAVASVTKISETDRSGLAASSQNTLTLYTCVEDQSAYRWCVKAVEIV